MTLSIKRAIEHGGLLEKATSELSEGSLFFLAPKGIPIGVVLSDDGEVEVFSDVETWGDKKTYTALAMIGRGSAQQPVSLQASVSGDTVTLRTASVSPHDFTLILGTDRTEEFSAAGRSFGASLSSIPTSGFDWDWEAIGLQSLNGSLIEGFMWAQIMREVRSENTVTDVAQDVYASQVLLETATWFRQGKSVPQSRVIGFDFSGKAENPGIPLRITLGVEYDDAQRGRKGELSLKDVCGVAKTSTCFGGDAPCTYDDYVFARAAGECASCAQQTQVRGKFKVK